MIVFSDNPVVAARMYDLIIRAFIDVAFGVPMDHFTGKFANVRKVLKPEEFEGIFGRASEVIGVTEAQYGGKLHFHGHIFGIFDHQVIGRWIHEAGFREEVTSLIDQLTTARIPEEVRRGYFFKCRPNLKNLIQCCYFKQNGRNGNLE